MNYILIVADSLRADFALNPLVTPNLHRFIMSHGGWIFKNCYSTSTWTLPVQMSLYTGLLPSHHGMTDITFAHRRKLLAENPKYFHAPNCTEEDFIMTKLKKKGYTCKYFTPDYHKDFLLETAHYLHDKVIPWDYFYMQTDKVFDESIEKPFFWMLYDLDCHSPYGNVIRDKKEDLPPRDEQITDNLARQLPDSYPTEVLHTLMQDQVLQYDRKLEKFLAWFIETGLYKDTALFITADHGEALWEHNWVGHVFNVYEDIIRVPLFMYYPAILRNEARMRPIGDPVSILDINPTILGLQQSGDGRNLFVRRRDRKVFFEFTRLADPKPEERVWQSLPSPNTFIRGSRFSRYKYIYTKTMDGRMIRELYNFRNGRHEGVRHLVQEPEMEEVMLAALREQYEGIE